MTGGRDPKRHGWESRAGPILKPYVAELQESIQASRATRLFELEMTSNRADLRGFDAYP